MRSAAHRFVETCAEQKNDDAEDEKKRRYAVRKRIAKARAKTLDAIGEQRHEKICEERADVCRNIIARKHVNISAA